MGDGDRFAWLDERLRLVCPGCGLRAISEETGRCGKCGSLKSPRTPDEPTDATTKEAGA
jgi:ribosomal protein L37E